MGLIRRRPTSAFRLALLLAGLFTLFSLVTAAGLWLGSAHEARIEQRSTINADARDLVLLSYQHGLDALSTEIEERVILNANLPRWYALYAANGIKLAGNLDHEPKATGWSQLEFTPRATRRAPAPAARTLTLYTLRTAQHGWLVVGRDAFYLHRMRTVAERIYLVALSFIVLASLLVGTLIGRQLSRRVRAMSTAAEAISAGKLELRMPRRGNGDELDLIASTINSMLDRIAALLADVRRVGADIAHDLRTPLTRVRQRLERLQRRPPADELALQQELDQAIAGIDDLLNVFQALLRIARVEAGEMRRDFAEVPLRALVRELSDTYTAVAEGEGHRLILQGDIDASIHGDRELLVQAMVNLIENAIRHTPAGCIIRVGLLREVGHVHLFVSDNGPGIPESQYEQVLEPFLRLESSRHTEGNGLGLSLVRSVAELHGATLLLEDAGPGLSVRLVFPATG